MTAPDISALLTAALMEYPETRAVIGCLASTGREARFVGGSVRDALLRKTVSDIDIATPLLPEEVMELLQNCGIRAIPTGIGHGTVTALLGGRPYEITTLRRDIACDGRHAEVVFTDNWQEDAARRDFTINAMSCTAEGKLYDYFGGMADLAEGTVRFVGKPEQRIAEDYLRILRFFRFTGYYGKSAIDAPGLVACRMLAGGLSQLSGERIYSEMGKLLLSPYAPKMLEEMEKNGLLSPLCLPENSVAFSRLCAIEAALALESSLVRRLAGFIEGCKEAAVLSERWKLPTKVAKAVMEHIKAAKHLQAQMPMKEKAQKRWLRHYGKALFTDSVLIAAAYSPALFSLPALQHLVQWAKTWEVPLFPVSGKDIMGLGIPSGKAVGEWLKKAECWWEEGDYQADKAAIMAYIKASIVEKCNRA